MANKKTTKRKTNKKESKSKTNNLFSKAVSIVWLLIFIVLFVFALMKMG